MPEANAVKAQKECRACGGKHLTLFFDLGDMALANSFIKKEDLAKSEGVYPLRVFFCEDCSHSQLGEVVHPDILFRDYVYFSSSSRTLPEHFRKYADDIITRFANKKNDLVIEIGSNDGVLLGAIQAAGVRVLGVDPAENIAKLANAAGIPTIPAFWSEKLAAEIQKEHGPAKVVVGNNVVAHIDDWEGLVRGVSTVLADDGAFMFEAPYMKDMFEYLRFDTIYHEHLSYLTVRPLVSFFKRFGMEVFDVKISPVHGNSLRVYAGKAGVHPISPAVGRMSAEEERLGFDKLQTYFNLERDIRALRVRLVGLLQGLKHQGKTIAAYGAPAKGNTLLNYFGIGPDILDYATEEMPSKIGLLSPGMHVPVMHIDDSRNAPPDYYLLLAWNAKDAIVRNEKKFLEGGGKFILPIGYETEIISLA